MLSIFHASLINGRFPLRRRGRRVSLIDPSTEQPFHAVYNAHVSDVDAAAKGAIAAWENGWREMAPGARSAILFRLAALIEEYTTELAKLDSRSMGKPLARPAAKCSPAHRRFAFTPAPSRGRSAASSRRAWRPRFHRARATGVVTCIVPWNFPVRDRLLESRTGARGWKLRVAQAGHAIAARGARAKDGSRWRRACRPARCKC